MENNHSRPPKVSVMMCVYNGQAHIAEAVASILAQSFADLELIVVDLSLIHISEPTRPY